MPLHFNVAAPLAKTGAISKYSSSDEIAFIRPCGFRVDSFRMEQQTTNMRKQYRHGDVLIEEVKSLPQTREKLQHTVLAHGEVTGHCHRIKESDDADLYFAGGELYLHVRGESVSVVHEEHTPIQLTTGFYRVWRQREYSPKEIRIVRD